MITCTFAGHRVILHAGIREKLQAILSELMTLDTQFCFYSGGMGEFDRLAEASVRRMKREFPEKAIRLVLVLPYMNQSVNEHAELYRAMYDEIVIPEVSEKAHFKRAIALRNRWMAEQSQILIAYVHRDYGGAYEMAEYARKAGVFVREVRFTPV